MYLVLRVLVLRVFTWSQCPRFPGLALFRFVNISGVCVFLPGSAVSCRDNVRNGNEAGVDCGGPQCPPCQTPTSAVLEAAVVWGAVGSAVVATALAAAVLVARRRTRASKAHGSAPVKYTVAPRRRPTDGDKGRPLSPLHDSADAALRSALKQSESGRGSSEETGGRCFVELFPAICTPTPWARQHCCSLGFLTGPQAGGGTNANASKTSKASSSSSFERFGVLGLLRSSSSRGLLLPSTILSP